MKAWHLLSEFIWTISSFRVSSTDTFSLSLPAVLPSQSVTLTQLSKTCKLFSPERLNVIWRRGLLFPFIFTLEKDLTVSFLAHFSSSCVCSESTIFATPLLSNSSFFCTIETEDESSGISWIKCWNSLRIKLRIYSSILSVSVDWSILTSLLLSLDLKCIQQQKMIFRKLLYWKKV